MNGMQGHAMGDAAWHRELKESVEHRSRPRLDDIDSINILGRIEALEAALRYVREMIGPSAPECSGCATEWGMAIAKINEVLK